MNATEETPAEQGLADPDAFASLTAATMARLRALASGTSPTRPVGAPTVGAVVVTRDRPDMLSKALNSIAQNSSVNQTLVLDNASSPAMADVIADECAKRPGVVLHRSEENLGCAGGRRLGVKLVQGDPILMLDDDAELLPGALEHMLAQIEHDPDACAVSATVLAPDGRVSYSGGSLEVADGIATFGLIGAGTYYDDASSLPASGPCGWVPGGASLTRRELLETFPIDDRMVAYHEDNEWCYRVSLERPGCFRRSREALVMHYLSPERTAGIDEPTQEQTAGRLAAYARFYERHGVLMAPWVLGILPGLQAGDGSSDPADVRLLMELTSTRGAGWVIDAWQAGELEGLLRSHARQHDLTLTSAKLERTQADLQRTHDELQETLAKAREESERLYQALADKEHVTAFLHKRHETLTQIEDGGWWRLREQLLPLLKLAQRAQQLAGRMRGGSG